MRKRKERDAIVFLNEQLKMAGEVLAEGEMGRLVNMLRAYAMEGEEPDLSLESRLFRSIFGMMKSAQDKAIEKYEETCERNRRTAAKRLGRVVTGGDGLSQDAPGVTNLIKSNRIKSNQTDDGVLYLRETGETGVPGCAFK